MGFRAALEPATLGLKTLDAPGGDMSKRHARIVPADRTITRLEQKHAELAAQVAALDGRLSLTASEEMELQRLKKEKLHMKDALQDVRP